MSDKKTVWTWCVQWRGERDFGPFNESSDGGPYSLKGNALSACQNAKAQIEARGDKVLSATLSGHKAPSTQPTMESEGLV